MTTSRWVCPLCGAGKLAPGRPRRDDARRYCLPCSDKTGRLVERVSPKKERAGERTRVRAGKRRRRRHVFRPPAGYYRVSTVDVSMLWAELAALHHLVPRAVGMRMRTTQAPGPVSIRDGVLTLRKGSWADRHDARAQVVVAAARLAVVHYAMRYPHAPSRSRARAWMRGFVHEVCGVRPRLARLSQAEVEVAALLRSTAAVALLGDLPPASDFRTLRKPYVILPGVPVGLIHKP